MVNGWTFGIREAALLGGVILLTSIALWGKNNIFRKISKNQRHSFSLIILEKFCSAMIFFVGLMLVLDIFGMDIIPILTVSGIGAAILGFASRDFFANFFGGLMIYAARPFIVHETIELPGKKIVGRVEEIGWYFTTIRDPEKRKLYIPNSLFSTEFLINTSRMSHRFVDEKLRFRISEEEKVVPLIRKIRELVKNHPGIDPHEQIDVFLTHIGPWGAEIEIKAYTKSSDYSKYMEVKQEILLSAHQAGDVRT